MYRMRCVSPCYLFAVSNSRLLFSRGVVSGFSDYTFDFQSVNYIHRRKTSCNLEPWPMTLTFQLDLDQHDKYLRRQKSFSWQFIVRTQTGPTALSGPLKLSIKHLQFLTNRITLERFHNLPAPQQQQVPVAGGRLRPGAPLANWTKRLRLWPIRSIMCNMTSSTKPEVHNVLHCRQRRSEPRPQVTCTEKFGEVCMCGFWDTRADRQTDKETYRHGDQNTSQRYRQQSN